MTKINMSIIVMSLGPIKPSANECQKTRNKKHETIRFSTTAIYRLRHSKTKNIVSRNVVSGIKQCLIREICFHRNMCKIYSQSTIYFKSHGCVHDFQHEVSLTIVSTMLCLPCALSRSRSLRDAKPTGFLFV